MSNDSAYIDLALQPVTINTNCEPQYAYRRRLWQGTPAIERTRNGRLWVAFCTGGSNEGPDNYVLLIRSDNYGQTWSAPVLAIDPPDRVRAFDPCLWHDPQGVLWLFWSQSYGMFDGRCGVWATSCANADEANPQWTQPRRIANGIMNNKPTVLSTGQWLLPAAIWAWADTGMHDLSGEQFSNVYVSRDEGASFELLGSADVPDRSIDQHMIVERRDGSLWMLVRLFGGIGESVSWDQGKTWSPGMKSPIAGPNSRFFIRRLKSGRLLLINHYRFTLRNRLTALLSNDDGATWEGSLLLDERPNVSCPDAVEGEDGFIYVVYDRDRVQEREILMAVFTEEDVMAGIPVTPGSRFKAVVDKAR